MRHLKYLKTFEFFKDDFSEKEVITYTQNGEHIWDENDTIISLYYFRMRQKNSSFENINNKVNLDRDDLERDLQNDIGMTSDELAQDVIGCSEGALVTNSLVTEFYVTGRDTGRKNGNHYQVNMSEELKNASLEELKDIVDNIINKIESDEKRLTENKKAKEIRAELKGIRSTQRDNKEKAKSLEDRKRLELDKDLKSHNIKKAKSLSEIEGSEVELDTVINHPKFGRGIVIEVNDKMSLVKFDGVGDKVMANNFIIKFSE